MPSPDDLAAKPVPPSAPWPEHAGIPVGDGHGRDEPSPRRPGPPLTQRMEALAALVVPGASLADVGTDHGWLPIALLARGRISSAIAIDLREAPLDVATRNAAQFLDDERRAALSLVMGDGLAPLSDAVGTCVIAGMGGGRIATLLGRAQHHPRWPLARRFLLAPNDGAPTLRAALMPTPEGRPSSLGLRIVDESMVEERGRYFPIVVAEPLDGDARERAGRQPARDLAERELDVYAGAILRVRRDATWLAWLQWRRSHLLRAAARATSHSLSTAAARELAWVETLIGPAEQAQGRP